MKRVLFILALFTNPLPHFDCSNLSGVGNYGSPKEPNAWAGARLVYPVIGKAEKFDLSFELAGKFVIDFT